MPPCDANISSKNGMGHHVEDDHPPRAPAPDDRRDDTTTTTPAPAAATKVIRRTPEAPVYVRCDSTEPFDNPLSSPSSKSKSAAEINATELNLNLGQSVLVRERSRQLLRTIRFLSDFLVQWWERALFRVWDALPVAVRRQIQYVLWRLYLPLHKLVLGRRTAIHPDASPEYHAMTTAMWAGRFFPVSVERMRFMLRQLTTWQPRAVDTRTTWIETVCDAASAVAGVDYVPTVQREHCTVRGIYLHHRPPAAAAKQQSNNGTADAEPASAAPATEYTFFWLYGGAFLAGDAAGNMGPAHHIASQTGMDVFLPNYRLAPEADIHDILWDVVLAYRWLSVLRRKRGQDPSKIILFGCSSGAALCTRLVQFLAEHARGETLLPSYISVLLDDDNVAMPSGCVLVSPFVDFTHDKPATGSFHQYAKHDLIVNESVLEAGLPFLDTNMCGHRVSHSPVVRSFADLPPLCVLVSEHETVYDETCLLINRARAAGTSVTVGLWRYMCHVWVFLNGFVPEGEQAMEFIVEWIRERQQQPGTSEPQEKIVDES